MIETTPQVIITLNRSEVESIFLNATTQADYLIGLYKLVQPRWDEIATMDGYPSCSKDTWGAICRLCQVFDEKINKTRSYDKQIMPGGAWLNSGFSANHDYKLLLWEVVPATKVTYKESNE